MTHLLFAKYLYNSHFAKWMYNSLMLLKWYVYSIKEIKKINNIHLYFISRLWLYVL